MQAWGPGSFENEPANDWLEDLIETQDFDMIPMAMHGLMETIGTDELELVDCCVAMAAAELVAAANKKPLKELPPTAKQFIEEHNLGATKSMLAVARKCLDILVERSPLRTHWKSADQLVEWMEAVEDLAKRLQA